ncbi:hypothetical protein EMCRGX_G033621 [Ephydatia muelleri]
MGNSGSSRKRKEVKQLKSASNTVEDQQRVIQIQQLRDCLSDTLFQNAQLIAQIRDLKVQMAVVCKEKENVQHLCAELIALIDDLKLKH